jgi:hypothetical protein
MIGGFHHDAVDLDSDAKQTITGSGRSVFRAVAYLSDKYAIVPIHEVVTHLEVDEITVRTGASRWTRVCGSLLKKDGSGLQIPENVVVDLLEARKFAQEAPRLREREQAIKALARVELIFWQSEQAAMRQLKTDVRKFRKDRLQHFIDKATSLRHTARMCWTALSYLSGDDLSHVSQMLKKWTDERMNDAAARGPQIHNVAEMQELWYSRFVIANEIGDLESALLRCPTSLRPTNTLDQLKYFCHGYFQMVLLDLAMECACEQSINGDELGIYYGQRFRAPARIRLALERLHDANSERFVASVLTNRGVPRLAEVLARAVTDKQCDPSTRLKAAYGLLIMLSQPRERVTDLLLSQRNVDPIANMLVGVIMREESIENGIIAVANGSQTRLKNLRDTLIALEANKKHVSQIAADFVHGFDLPTL